MKKRAFVEEFKEMGTAPFGFSNDKTKKVMDWFAEQDSAIEKSNGYTRKFGTSHWNEKLASMDKEALSFGSSHRMNRVLAGKSPEINTKKALSDASKKVSGKIGDAWKEKAKDGLSFGSSHRMNRALAGKDPGMHPIKGMAEGGSGVGNALWGATKGTGRGLARGARALYENTSSHGKMNREMRKTDERYNLKDFREKLKGKGLSQEQMNRFEALKIKRTPKTMREKFHERYFS